ncbi:glutathione S-transferase family protein [Derxia gummosa]|uniref:Glutathione S-transferase family protein n=1 Tax=Derxia gummosa DSM 723 TaxID=1121388 RepID=A0A8B6X5I0_9BURK|nr:glutathione S-transferase family protein [Derxia gummosa]
MYELVIADKNYSSWSMRAWVLMRHLGLDFTERLVRLAQPDTAALIGGVSPSGRVPVLLDDGFAVWDSLAIAEYLAERHPELRVWPADARARARARSVSAEMHAGFQALRQNMSMNIRKRSPGLGHTPEALAEVARIDAMWSGLLAEHGGPFLFGAEFTAADAMYAPVATRFVTYSAPLSAASQAYVEAVLGVRAVAEWIAAGVADPVAIEKYDRPHEQE